MICVLWLVKSFEFIGRMSVIFVEHVFFSEIECCIMNLRKIFKAELIS